jgi:hypothetical protein
MSPLSLVTTLILLGAGPGGSPPDEARAVIEKAVKAHGGSDKLVTSHAIYMKVQVKIDQIPGNATMEGEAWEQGNDRQKTVFRIDLAGTKMTIAQGLRDGKSWRDVNGDVQDLSAAELTDMKRSQFADRVQSLVPLLTDKKFALTALGPSKLEDVAVVGVKVATPGQPDVLLFFDEKTGLLKKIEYKTKLGGADDKEVPYATVLDDYRTIDTTAADVKVLKEMNVASDGAALLTFLRSQIRGEADRKAIKELIKQLADETFEVREKSTTQLIALGPVAIPFLQEAAKDDDAEVVRRAKHCLEKIGSAARPDGAIGAALRLVASRKPAGAAEALLGLAPSVTDPALKNELYWALEAVAVRDGKPEKIVEQALDDKDPARRAAATAALGKDGGALAKQPGRRLAIEGVKRPMKMISYRNGTKEAEIEITEIQIVNKFDDAIFDRPKK